MQDANTASIASIGEGSTTAARDLGAFLASVERPALRTASIRLGNPEDGLDAVQDAMERLASHYANRPPDEWTPLFWSILRRRIIDMQRRRKVRSIVGTWVGGRNKDHEPLPPQEPADTAPGPFETLADVEAMQALEQALRTLPARQYEAFSLRVLNELDVRTTARVMGCSEGSVKTHLSRARAALGQCLEDWK